MPVNIDLEEPFWLRDEKPKELKKQEQYSNTKEYDGKNYVVLGKTFNTSINAKEGDIIEVRVQELTVSDDELTWAKPQVVGVDKDRDTPYDADQCVRLAKDYESVLQKSEVSENGKMGETGQKALEQKEDEGSQQELRSDIQERNLQKAKEIEPEEEGGRDLFNVNEGDEGKISIDEHMTFLNEEEAKEFKGVDSYDDWQNAKDKIGNVGSIHNDVRLHMDDKDYLIGFTPTVGKITDRNKLVDYKEGEKILVPSFKKHCVTPYTLIYTVDGFKRASELTSQDYVLSHDGSFCKVTEVNQHTVKSSDLVQVQTSYTNIPLVITDNHPFLTRGGWRDAGQLEKGDELEPITVSDGTCAYPSSLLLRNNDGYEKQIVIDEDFLYFLGFFAGDGYTRSDKGFMINLAFDNYKDQDHILRLRSIIRDKLKIKHVCESQQKDCTVLVFHDEPLAKWLCQHCYEWVGGYSGKGHVNRIKRLPSWLYSLPANMLWSVVKGLLDSDGMIHNGINNWGYTFSNTSFRLLGQMSLFLFKLGCCPKFYKIGDGNLFDIRWNDNNQQKFVVKNIKRLHGSSRTVCDITVAGTSTFCLPQAITHNTGHGKLGWMEEVGQDRAWIFEPGEPGAPKGQWSVIYKVEPSAKIKFGEVDEHYIEFKITGTKRMPEGRWMLSYVPVGGGNRKWMLSHPEKQEFESEYLKE